MACMEYVKFLKKVSDKLTSTDMKRLRFLCRDLLTTQSLEKATGGLQLFRELEKVGQLRSDDVSFILESMTLICRIDIVNITKATWSEPSYTSRDIKINQYRRLLNSLAQDITSTDFDNIKCLAHGYLRGDVEPIQDMMEFFTVMEKQGVIAEDNVEVLYHIVPHPKQKKMIRAFCKHDEEAPKVQVGACATNTAVTAQMASSTCGSTSNGNEDCEDSKAELERLRDGELCKICMDKDMSTVYIPCNHMVTCNECAETVSSCPICRTEIKNVVYVYKT